MDETAVVRVLRKLEQKVDLLRDLPELPANMDERIKELQRDLNLIWEYLGD